MTMSDTFALAVRDAQTVLRRIGQVRISSLSNDEAISTLRLAMHAGEHLKVAFANSHVINIAAREPAFAEALMQSLVLPDGIGVDLGSRLLYGAPFVANLNGTDFIPRLIASSTTPLKIGLIGGRPGVAERAMQNLSAMSPQHRFRVFSHGYFAPSDEATILADMAADRSDLLLVAFGNPRQEIWIAKKLGQAHCSVAAGVGALFDFQAGEVMRAPRFVLRLRFEWLFRLAQEPVRLWWRYVLGNPAFLTRVLWQKWRGI